MINPLVAPESRGILSWLRSNLALTISLVSIASAVVGAVVNGSVRLENFDYRIVAIESALKPDRMGQLELRLSGDENVLSEHRIAQVEQFGQINTRLGILEQQVKFIGDLERDRTLNHIEKSR